MNLEAMHLSDEQLVAGLGEGRVEALLTLYDRYAPLAFATASRVTGDEAIAVNVVAEAFLMAWRGASGYRPATGSVDAWLLGTVQERAVYRSGGGIPGTEELPPSGTVAPIDPPPSLRTRVGATATGDLATGRHPAAASAPDRISVQRLREGRDISGLAAGTPLPPPAPRPEVTKDGLPVPRRGPRWFIGIVGAIIIFILGASAVLVRQDLASAQRFAQGVDLAITLAAQPGSVSATLVSATGGEEAGLAAIGRDGEVRLVLRGLAATSGAQVYSTWVQDGTSTVRVGEFTVGANGAAVAGGAGAPAAADLTVLVTLEPASGAIAPTTDPVASGITAPAPEP